MKLHRMATCLASATLFFILWVAFVTGNAVSTGRAESASARSAQNCVGPPCGPIQHVIFIVKENRTFDSLFGRFPGAHGASTFRGRDGITRRLTVQPSIMPGDISHNLVSARIGMDGGAMDNFRSIPYAVQNGVDMADSQLPRAAVPNYWRYARRYALADNLFSSVLGNSFANHLFTVAAGGGNAVTNPSGPNWGCDAAYGVTVKRISPGGRVTLSAPCFDFPTITDQIERAGLSWRYYAPDARSGGYIWSTLDAIRHVRFGPQWASNVVDYRQFAADAAAGRLPSVSWLTQPATLADHPPHDICWGENWTVQNINAIMSNHAAWGSTVIVVVWDDFGGFYDHVKPPAGPNSLIQYGPRVPALIISPYARSGSVDHHFYTLTSLVKLAESVFGLPPLPHSDVSPGDLTASLDLHQVPLAPRALPLRACPSPMPAAMNGP